MRVYTEHGESQEQWEATAEATAATATATKAAAVKTRHFVTDVFASFSAAAIALLTIKRGATVILRQYVHNAERLHFRTPLRGNVNEAVSAELASGGAGITGEVNLVGYSRPE